MFRCITRAALASALTLAGSSLAAAQTTWTGPYVGATVGAGFQMDDADETVTFDTNLDGMFTDTVRTIAGVDAFSPGFCPGIATGPTPGAGCSEDEDGLDVGGRAGYDWQRGMLVVGALVDVVAHRCHRRRLGVQHDAGVLRVFARAEGRRWPARPHRRRQRARARLRHRRRRVGTHRASVHDQQRREHVRAREGSAPLREQLGLPGGWRARGAAGCTLEPHRRVPVHEPGRRRRGHGAGRRARHRRPTRSSW